MAGTRIGVDTGGTFTDLVMLGESGVVIGKVRSTPDDPSRAILAGIGEITVSHGEMDVVHGSTVATNAVLERKGARVALLTTAGFEDVVRIGRQTRPELYNLMMRARAPIVEPELTFGIAERLAADGSVLQAVQKAEIEKLASHLHRTGITVVAVCLLHSYRNPAHEETVARVLERSGFAVSVSSRVLREYREYERWSTTIVNAYVTPLMSQYLSALETHLGDRGLRIMQSNGGSISAATAKSAAVRTILSGPAAGVVGAGAVGAMAGLSRLITFDMGGTSTDVSLVDGRISITTESAVGDFPVRLPVIDIHTVGAGGGSIAYIDSGGALRVGPRSAGADPGPACYGKGTELTVTDANLLLGRLDVDYFLGGRMALDLDRTRAAARRLASQLNVSEHALADGVIRVANANMERAIRVVSVQRGHDPRDFALLAFGGAGGMHACDLASKLDITAVVIPRYAGVLSALGMLLADVTMDYSVSVLRRSTTVSREELSAMFVPMEERAAKDLKAEGFEGDRAVVVRALDVRYVGQSYEITVPMGADYRERFDREHERLYGYANPTRATEIVNLRLSATGLTEHRGLPRVDAAQTTVPEPARMSMARFGSRSVPTAVYRWEHLAPGSTALGPAVIAGGQATAVIAPGFRFSIDPFGNVVAVRGAQSARRAYLEPAVAAAS